MAQLLLINAITKADDNNLNDVVSIVGDTIALSIREQDQFTLVHVDGTPDEIRERIGQVIPDRSVLASLKTYPRYTVRYVNGQFIHNYRTGSQWPS